MRFCISVPKHLFKEKNLYLKKSIFSEQLRVQDCRNPLRYIQGLNMRPESKDVPSKMYSV